MKTTHDFKVGDIVRFKLEDDHQKYAMYFYDRINNLKISKIIKMQFGPDLVNFEGYPPEMDSFTFRLEKQPNMFAFGKKNPKIKKLFLQYLEKDRSNGLCWWTERNSLKAYDFLRSQVVFEKEGVYPVEYFVLRSMKKNTSAKFDRYEMQYANHSYNSPDTPEGRLRIWWANNLAIAASQGKI